MSAVVRLTMSNRPSVSTAIWRLRPTIFFPASQPRFFGRRRLDRLAVDDPRRRARRAARSFAIYHERNIMDGSEQKHPDEATELKLSARAENPSAAFASQRGTGHIADRVQYLTQVYVGLAALFGRSRQERRDPLPFLARQIGRIPLRLLRNIGHPATIRWGPHPKLELHAESLNTINSSNGL